MSIGLPMSLSAGRTPGLAGNGRFYADHVLDQCHHQSPRDPVGRGQAWADNADVPWFPAAPVDVRECLTALVGRGIGIATVRQVVPAIEAAHRTAGVDSLGESRLSRQNRWPDVQPPVLPGDTVEPILATAR